MEILKKLDMTEPPKIKKQEIDVSISTLYILYL